MELKLESGLPHQEYAVEAISEVFKQVEINQQVAHYSNPVIDLRSNRFIGNIYRIQQRERQNVAEKYRNEQPVGNTDRKSTRLNSSHNVASRMPSSA